MIHESLVTNVIVAVSNMRGEARTPIGPPVPSNVYMIVVV
jgi:hypothetical protein